ncbi:MAG: hypothetical protein ABI468_00770 [Candidatus Nanopelagicales bacterium]
MRRPTNRTAIRVVAVSAALASLALGPGALAEASGPARNTAATAAALLIPDRTASAGTVYTIGPSDNLQTAMGRLRPGQTLALKAGTYRTNYLRMYAETHGTTTLQKGTVNAPITLTSADPAHPALLYGGLQLSFADYWHISNLGFQATVKGYSALYMDGGVGWSVTGSVFTGARATGSYANVAIAGSKGGPSKFTFSGNCVYDGATTNRGNTDQNIYVSFPGSAATSGVISRNIIYSAPQGQAVKLGNGGKVGAIGPWNVVVSNNTMVSNGRQVLLFGNVRNNKIVGNLFVTATAPFTSNPQTTQVYVSALAKTGNLIRGNYGYAASMFSYDPSKVASYSANGYSNAASANPRFNAQNCGAFHPANPTAAQYGRYGTTH